MSYDPNDPGAGGGQAQPRYPQQGGQPQQGYPQQQAPGYPQQQPGYPPYGPPPVQPKGSGCGKMLAIGAAVVVGLIVVLVIVGVMAGSDDGTAGDETGSGEDAPAAGTDDGQEVYAIGQTAHTGEFDVTVHAVQDPFTPTNEFETPQAGQRFVAVEATITNTSEEPLPFSTLAGVELIDQLDRPFSIAIAGTDLPQLDAATVAPGEARRGWIVFDVPPDATELRIRIKGNLTANGSVFKLT